MRRRQALCIAGGPYAGAACRTPCVAGWRNMRCIAGQPELWFEKPGFPPVPPHRKATAPVATMPCSAGPDYRSLSRATKRTGLRQGRRARERIDDAGAQAVIGFCGHGGDRSGRRRRRLAATAGQPQPWELGLQQAATPVMDDIVWFHDFLLWIIGAIALFVLALLADRDGQVQRPRQSGALAHHPQHRHRSDLDRGAGADPGGDRGALVPPAVLSSSTCRRPT